MLAVCSVIRCTHLDQSVRPHLLDHFDPRPWGDDVPSIPRRVRARVLLPNRNSGETISYNARELIE